MFHSTRVLVVSGTIAGWVTNVIAHPNGQRIWLACVLLGSDRAPVQIVFGGGHRIRAGDFVPVAPPGAKVIIERQPLSVPKPKKMRVRGFRGERSHGMLCSLDELGWAFDGPDEVATLRNVLPGEPLDHLSFAGRVARVERHRRFVVAPPLDDQPRPGGEHRSESYKVG